MAEEYPNRIEVLLESSAAGEKTSIGELLALVYNELHAIAQKRMAGLGGGQTLQPTALVNEAYVRMVGRKRSDWAGRDQFLFVAARAMRDIMVEQARRKGRLKRGGDRKRVDADVDADMGIFAIDLPVEDVVAIDEALRRLEAEDSRKGEVVNLRFFLGLNREETAEKLGISVETVDREWRYVRTWLKKELSGESRPETGDHE